MTDQDPETHFTSSAATVVTRKRGATMKEERKRHRWDIVAAIFLGVWVIADFTPARLMPREPCREYSQQYHHGLKKNCNGDPANRIRRHTLYTNSLGCKDRGPREFPLYTDKCRIVFMGDSFCEGMGLPYEDTFVGILDNMISGSRVEILNAGVSTYSPKLYYLRIKNLLNTGLKIDELVVLIDMGDLVDEIVYERWEPGTDLPLSDKLAIFLETNSLSYRVLLPRLRLLFWTLYGTPVRAHLGADLLEHWSTVQEYWEAQSNWTTEEGVFERWGRRGLALAESNMDKLIGLCKSRGTNVTLVVYPWPQEILRGNLKSKNPEVWKQYAAKAGVRFLDLYPEFIIGEDPSGLWGKYFLPNDYHWNRDSNCIVAKFMYRYLVSRNLL